MILKKGQGIHIEMYHRNRMLKEIKEKILNTSSKNMTDHIQGNHITDFSLQRMEDRRLRVDIYKVSKIVN